MDKAHYNKIARELAGLRKNDALIACRILLIFDKLCKMRLGWLCDYLEHLIPHRIKEATKRVANLIDKGVVRL